MNRKLWRLHDRSVSGYPVTWLASMTQDHDERLYPPARPGERRWLCRGIWPNLAR